MVDNEEAMAQLLVTYGLTISTCCVSKIQDISQFFDITNRFSWSASTLIYQRRRVRRDVVSTRSRAKSVVGVICGGLWNEEKSN
jgi:hypothetical protein